MEKRKMREIDFRCIMLMSVMLLMCVILVSKLFDLQIRRYDEYQNKVIDNIQQETEVPAERGVIYDRNMVALATNVTTYRLFVSPNDIIRIGSGKFVKKDGMKQDEVDRGQKQAADEQIMVAQPEFVNEIGFGCDFADDRMTNAHMQYPS